MKTGKKRFLLSSLGGLVCGVANGLLGAGGGMVAVPMLQKSGLSEVKSHATSVAVILPLCLLSAVFYLLRGDVTLGEALPYLPWMVEALSSGHGSCPNAKGYGLGGASGCFSSGLL